MYCNGDTIDFDVYCDDSVVFWVREGLLYVRSLVVLEILRVKVFVSVMNVLGSLDSCG